MNYPSLTQLAKATAVLVRYQDRELWYRLYWHDDPQRSQYTFAFPISVDDPAATGEFRPEMRGTEVLRWARKHVEFLQKAEKESQVDGTCAQSKDGIHCEHWWDGDACCTCGAPAMDWHELRAQGMEP